jgi:cell division cycle protein 20 (cofactor of APC complex)
MEQVAEIRDAHDTRVLYSALSPAGDVIATAAGDENLKFWRLWEVETVRKTKGVKESRSNSTSSSMLAIR